MKRREIDQIIKGTQTMDGGGVNLKRLIAGSELNMLDPFLLFDEFGSDNPKDYIAGFPPHPHRGFETITYMINGKFRHEDTAGNKGYLEDGSVQWMTAGKGVIHSEMPEQSNGLLKGFQLWLNLPKSKKYIEPAYQDIPSDKIPIVKIPEGHIKIIAGSFNNKIGPGKSHTKISYFDIALEPNSSICIPIKDNWNSFCYIYEGKIEIDKTLSKGHLGVLNTTGIFKCSSLSKRSRFILVSGERLNEPVARGGPFVMNTKEEILQAFQDYQSGILK